MGKQEPKPNLKRHPKSNDPRKTNQPFYVDRLPSEVREAIAYLYTKAGLTWDQLEERSAAKFDPNWMSSGGGFVNWGDLPLSTLELFPELKIPKSNMHRWFKVRISQAGEATKERAEYARQLAASFVGASVKGDKDAVLNAARDIFFGIITEDGSLPARAAAGKALLALAKEQQKARTNDIRERLVSVEERRVKQLEAEAEARRRKMDAETEKLSKKASKGEITPADIDRLRERVFGLPPKSTGAAEVAAG
jgi:hypothetical protein